jgi:hypothetical protein
VAVSGSIDFTLTRDTCIKEALQQLGVLGAGESPTSDDLTDCGVTLNLMLKSWQNKPVAQTLIKKFYLFLNPDVRQYTLSTTAASSAASAYDFYADTLAADYADGGTDVEVTTGTGFADADEIIVIPDSGAWDASVGDVESGGGTTSLTVPDLNIDAESGNYAYAWTTRATKPREILYANRCQLPTSVGEDTVLAYTSNPVEILTRRDYAALSAKSTDGAVSAIWYEEKDETTGVIHTWPESSALGEFLEIWGQVHIDDMDSASDTFLLPNDWYLAVAFNLAKWLVPKYGVPDSKKKEIRALAEEALFEAEAGDGEHVIRLSPDKRRG